jgi:hypothetical protein
VTRRSRLIVIALAFVGASSAMAHAGEVKVTFANGRVTVIAKDATPREILDAWGRLGHTTLVNLERLGGAPVTLELVDLPEAKALKTLLRGAAGYIAAERDGAVMLASNSRYDRIVLMSGAAPTVTASAASAAPAVTSAAPAAPEIGRRSFVPPARVQPADDTSEGFASPSRPRGGQGPAQGGGFPAQPGYAGVAWTAPAPTHSPVTISPTSGSDYANAPQIRRQPAAVAPATGTAVTGAAVPGVSTAPPVLPSVRYTGDLPTSTITPSATPIGGGSSASVSSAAQPGVVTVTPSTFKNPYGVPDAPITTTVVPQNANPYGLPARTTTQDSTVTPIIKDGDPGGN